MKTLTIALLTMVLLSIILALKLCICEGADEIDDLVPYIIQVESSGNPMAVSEDGCVGLMQISPIVLKEFIDKHKNTRWDGWVRQLRMQDLHSNVNNKFIGIWYLKRLRDHYIPKDKYSIELLCACYNAGPTKMRKLNWDIKKAPRETRQYIKKVLKLYKED